jgi:integrase
MRLYQMEKSQQEMPLTYQLRTINNQRNVTQRRKIFGLERDPLNSNHLTSTSENNVFGTKNQRFKQASESVPFKIASRIRKRKPLKSRSGYPYHEPLLTPENFDITKTWYITFYAWDIGREELVRKRVLKDDLNAITDLEERKAFALQAMAKISEFLKNDYHLNRSPVPKMLAMDFRGYSFVNAITYAINEKKEIIGIKDSTAGKYESALSTVKEFLRWKKLPESYPLSNINFNFINQYFDYLKKERKIGNKTYNYRRGFLHAMFEVLIKKSDYHLFRGKNPCTEIELLQTQSKKHAAFTDDQLKAVVNLALSKKDFHVVLFIQFMYYTLARPNEIVNLRVGNIDMERRKILFKVSDAKTGIEEYVGINDRFYKIIQESGIMDHPGHYYVFCNETKGNRGDLGQGNFKVIEGNKNPGRKDERTYVPGPTRVGLNFFNEIIAQYIKDLKLNTVNPNFTPYGIKHTGAIGLFLATKDPKVVQIQCRHKKMDTTLNYLRDLGVHIDFDQINKWNGPI